MSKTDFDLTRVDAVIFDVDGELSPSTVPMNDDGVPMRMVNIKDGYALQLAAKRGLKIAIITGANTESLKKRYGALGIKDVFIGASRKLEIMSQWLAANGVSPENTAYVGDDIPDLQCMAGVGLGVAPADAAAEFIVKARFVTVAEGGYGVARELLEQILKAKGQWLTDAEAFGW